MLNNVHYAMAYLVKIVLYSLCLIVCNVSGSVAMPTRNHFTIGAHTRSGHINTALGFGLRTRPRLISVSPCYIICLELRIGITYRYLVSLATVKRVLKPEEEVTY